MTRSLKGKVILSYLAVALITVTVVSLVIWQTSGQSLMNLVLDQQTAMLKDTATAFYTSTGSMDGFFDYYIKSSRPDGGSNQPSGPDKPPKSRDIRGVSGLVDTQYRALIPTSGYDVGQIIPGEKIQKTIPVEVDGKTVAYILPDTGLQFKLSSEEQTYLQRSTLAVGLAALAGVLIAVVMGIFLAGQLLKPIRRLTQASQALAKGNLQQQVPVTSKDELGQLTTTFNQMSADLVKADEQRKRLTADITHDLSTPLQVISGYMEMLEAGEVNLTPQRIEIIKTEIGHLRRLVGDLSTLSQVEANGLEMQMQPIQPARLLERIVHAYQPIAAQQGIELILQAPESNSTILVDEGRMIQVLNNLVDNAFRYTPSGGQIKLQVEEDIDIRLLVQDSGSGIEPEDLPYIFERFYQADKARGANAGKMGLGLAICKALVTAQGGQISAYSAGKDQGATMVLAFPRQPANPLP